MQDGGRPVSWVLTMNDPEGLRIHYTSMADTKNQLLFYSEKYLILIDLFLQRITAGILARYLQSFL